MKKESLQFSEAEEKILDAALKVVNEKTISGTRMHLIAEKAEMVQSNVHYYYKTKQDLLERLQKRILSEIYNDRNTGVKKSPDTLEGQLHVFFLQKKHLILKKKSYDFAELNFIILSKIDMNIQSYFHDSYEEWRDSIREIIIRFCPDIDEANKELIPSLVVSLLEGASIQALIDAKDFEVDNYFDMAEKMVLNHIYDAMKHK